MSKTLAELRAMTAPKLPTFSYRLCLNLELIEKVQRLEDEKIDVLIAAEQHAQANLSDEDRESQARTRKAGQPLAKRPARVAEIDEEIAATYAEMHEFEGNLLMRGIDGARWQAYKDEHPPREGNVADETHGSVNGTAVVNTTDLMADLAHFAVSWDGEPLAEGDWSGWLAGRIAPGDLSELVARVVQMQEGRLTIPKALTVSPATTFHESDDDSPST